MLKILIPPGKLPNGVQVFLDDREVTQEIGVDRLKLVCSVGDLHRVEMSCFCEVVHDAPIEIDGRNEDLRAAAHCLRTLLSYFGAPSDASLKELGQDAYVEHATKVRVGDLMDARECLKFLPGGEQ